MGTGSSALLAHLAGVCISGHVTGALLGGHGVRRAEGSQGWRSARGPAPYWARAGAQAALRLLHQAGGSARGEWRMGTALGPSEHKGLMCNTSCNPHHQKHNCLSGSSSSASWFSSSLPLFCQHQKQQGLGQAPPSLPVEQNSVSPVFFTSPKGEALSWHWLLHQRRTLCCHHRSCFLVWGWHSNSLQMSVDLVLPGGCFVMTASPEEITSISAVFNCLPEYQKAMYKTVHLLLPKVVCIPLCFPYDHLFFSILFS